MRKIFRYLIPVVVGLGLGLGVIWLLSGFQPTKASPTVVAGGTGSRSLSVPASPTAIPASSTAIASSAPLNRPTVPPGIGSEYMALGDSVAYGLGAPVPNDQGFAGLFYNNYLKRVQPDLTTYRNLAVPGETSTSFISGSNGNKTKPQLQRALDELDAAAKAGRRVSPVTLTIGGNDMLEARGKSNAEREAALVRFDTNLSQILDELKANAGQADLIVTTYYNPYGYSSGGDDFETSWVQRFNDTIKRRAEEHGDKVADFFSPVRGHEQALTWIGVGDVHPNTAGHPVLAQALWKATGYDKNPPVLALTYSPLPTVNPVPAAGRLVFKFSAQDEWTLLNPVVSDTPGAGSLLNVSSSLDESAKTSLVAIPARFTSLSPGAQEFSYVLDTTFLASGPHHLHFEASDAAGNTGTLEINFEIA
jgi:lysophospholipase L1-like esterase